MKVTLWLTRDTNRRNYDFWTKKPDWDSKGWYGDWTFDIYPEEVKKLFHINWKGGKHSIRKLTVEI